MHWRGFTNELSMYGITVRRSIAFLLNSVGYVLYGFYLCEERGYVVTMNVRDVRRSYINCLVTSRVIIGEKIIVEREYLRRVFYLLRRWRWMRVCT